MTTPERQVLEDANREADGYADKLVKANKRIAELELEVTRLHGIISHITEETCKMFDGDPARGGNGRS